MLPIICDDLKSTLFVIFGIKDSAGVELDDVVACSSLFDDFKDEIKCFDSCWNSK